VIEVGKYNELVVKSRASIGLYLHDGDESVLLPARYVPENIHPGDVMKVFVYLDNENRPVATTLKPYAQLDDFSFLVVKDVNQHGAFLDWGIAKDIFVAYQEQRTEMEVGKKYLVHLFMDDFSGRIAATAKWSKYIDKITDDFAEGDEVNLLIAEKTDVGYKAIINNKFEGLLYHNEIFQPIAVGDSKKGFIKYVREDGKLDLTLQKQGFGNVLDSKDLILQTLKAHHGILQLGDKSSPEEITKLFSMSKKVFKKTIGSLYKDRLIIVRDHEIRLVDQLGE
jgi:predicted RNA-binding protein (virulence factor B family)